MYYAKDRAAAIEILAANSDRKDKPDLENMINAFSIFKYCNSRIRLLIDNDPTLAEFVCHSFWAGLKKKMPNKKINKKHTKN